MGRMGCFFLIVIALIVGYDQYRIIQLQNEVRAISGKVHTDGEKKKAGGGSDLVTSLAQAETHAKNAKDLLAKKKPAEAQVELDKVLASLKSANTVSEDIAGDVAEALGKARDNTIKVFQDTWKEISEEAKTKKVDVKRD